MALIITEEQTMLKDSAKEFCKNRAPVSALRILRDEKSTTGYDINVWKPEPDLFLHAATKMKVAPDRCVVIEDSIMGIDAGLAAGMQVIGFAQDLNARPLSDVRFVDSLVDLIPVLAG